MDPLSLNLYMYCSNNPVIYTDPSGHAAVIQYVVTYGPEIPSILDKLAKAVITVTAGIALGVSGKKSGTFSGTTEFAHNYKNVLNSTDSRSIHNVSSSSSCGNTKCTGSEESKTNTQNQVQSVSSPATPGGNNNKNKKDDKRETLRLSQK